MIEAAVAWLFSVFAISKIGLTAVFVVSFVSATLLPLGSEPAVFAMIKANPDLFWLTILVATAGNTLGGMLNYFIGYEAKQTFAKERNSRWFAWLERHGAKTMLLAWLPLIGDPICALGGWLKLPALPCLLYMAIGKFLRYVAMTYLLLSVPEGFWHRIAGWLA
ncbi:YqaA family protein [Undibacterium sp. Ji22W]|uniref:YqaA family protein n=1 Tax=Undibacterium sp. Ji22W TaxID=3413038 RepID=UPI003BF221C1